jgi:hypothetical protein
MSTGPGEVRRAEADPAPTLDTQELTPDAPASGLEPRSGGAVDRTPRPGRRRRRARAAASPGRWAGWWRLIAIAASLGACLLAMALSSPPGSAPDEQSHLEKAWTLSHGQPLDTPRLRVPVVLVKAYCNLPPATPRGPCNTPTGAIASPEVEVVNSTHLYPAAFHRALGWFWTSNLTSSVLRMRAFVSMLCVLLVMVPLVLVRVFAGATAVRAVGLPFLVCLSPLALFLMASVNPSSLEMAGGICSWGSVVALAQARRRWHVVASAGAMLIGVLAGFLTRPNGGLLLAASLFCAGPLLLTRVAPSDARRRRGFWAGVTAVYATGGLLAVLLISRGALRVQWLVNPPPPLVPHPPVWHWLTDALKSADVVLGAFGPLGWLDTPLPSIIGTITLAVGGYVVLGAIRRGRVAVAVSVALSAIVSLGLTTAVLASGIPPDGNVQTRYFWSVYIGVLFIAAAGLVVTDGLEDLLGGPVRVVLVAAMTLASTIAFFTNLRRYTTGLKEFPFLAPVLWQPRLLGVGGLLVAFVVGYVVLAWSVTGRGRRPVTAAEPT